MKVANVIAYYTYKNPLYMSIDIRFRMRFKDRLKFLLFGENCAIRVGKGKLLSDTMVLLGKVSGRMKITQCKGEGAGSCKRCTDNGKWNSIWMCFLYKIEGMEGCYCSDCVKELVKENGHDGTTGN